MLDLKKQFPIFENNPGLIYLDSASSSQKPRAVIEAESSFYEKNYANVHRGLYGLSQEATRAYEEARGKAASFINAESQEVIFTKGATEGLNFLASSLTKGFGAGDVVVLSEMEHHANLLPWQTASKRRGFEVRFMPVNGNGELDLSDAEKIFNGARIVSVTHASNVLGTVNDIGKIAELAHKEGAVMIADAAQSIVHQQIDVKKLGVDFLVFSGHKIYGPTGIGVLYGRRTLLSTLEPYQTGGEMVKSVTFKDAVWNEIPYRFEAGTPNIAGAVGLGRALEWLKDTNRGQNEAAGLLVSALTEGLRALGAKIYGPKMRIPLVSFTISGIHPHDLAEFLAERNIAVRAGHHCAMPLHNKLGTPATARVSLGAYNDEKDIEAFLNAVEAAKEKIGLSFQAKSRNLK